MDDLKKINVLMTGAGAPGGPGIIRCLQEDRNINLICCDIDPNASGKYLHENFEQILPADDESFISHILDLCIKKQIHVILPLVTKELFKFSEHKAIFESNCIKVIVSPFHSLSIANDKGKLLSHLEQNALVYPNYRIVSKYDELKIAIDDFLNFYGCLCIKPCISNGSRGVRLIDNSIDSYDLLFNHKPNSLYTQKQELLNILSLNTFPPLVVTELLDGEEYTVDTLIENGEPLLIAPRIRSKMNAGISVAGKFNQEQTIIEQVKSICKILPLSGPIGFQFKYNKQKGIFHILEINPRIQGSSVALVGAGVNLPLLAIYSAIGIPIKIPEIKWGTKFIRYYSEIYFK